MKNLKQYNKQPNIFLQPRNGFTNPIICGYVLEGRKKRPIVEATCKCGQRTQIRLNNYRSNNVKSCGCRLGRKNLKVDLVYPEYIPYDSFIHQKYNDYLKRSKSNNIPFNLTFEQFQEVFTKSCSYCGIENLPGVDRIDSTKGYTVDNIKACCKYCNRAKHQETEEDFLKWLHFVKST